MGTDGTEPVSQGLGASERGRLVQQLLEERRQRLEEKLAATAVPLIALSLAVDGALIILVIIGPGPTPCFSSEYLGKTL